MLPNRCVVEPLAEPRRYASLSAHAFDDAHTPPPALSRPLGSIPAYPPAPLAISSTTVSSSTGLATRWYGGQAIDDIALSYSTAPWPLRCRPNSECSIRSFQSFGTTAQAGISKTERGQRHRGIQCEPDERRAIIPFPETSYLLGHGTSDESVATTKRSSCCHCVGP